MNRYYIGNDGISLTAPQAEIRDRLTKLRAALDEHYLSDVIDHRVNGATPPSRVSVAQEPRVQ